MRNWNFGIFDAQSADFNGDNWGGRSIIVWGNTEDLDDGANSKYNTEYFDVGYSDIADSYRNQVAVDIAIAQIKAILGQVPVIIRADLRLNVKNALSGAWFEVFRMYTGWDIGDSTNRYKDESGVITWYQDAYSPYPGQDRATAYTDRTILQAYSQFDWVSLDIRPIAILALRNNESIKCLLHGYQGASVPQLYWRPDITTRRPNIDFWYLYPIEFYEDDGGNLDYSSPIQEVEDGHYYAGAVEAGQTGTPIKCHIRNFTGAVQQVEIFDDFPEWTTPVQRAGTGTGQLDHILAAENALSQKYTIIFYSATQYEVKAEAFRDYAIGLHPQIDANAAWRGAVGADKTLPEGGVTIPTTAWQGVDIVLGDEIEVNVRGNTTDDTWPSDSNDQMEMTYDNAGVADSANWRPMVARREKLTNTVAVDGASIFFPLRHIIPAAWPVDNKCFVHDLAKIDEGVIASTQERDLQTAPDFTGSGDDDLTVSGNYNGNENRTYRIQVDAEGTPDTFSWSRDGTTSWVATGVAIVDGMLLEDGIYLAWPDDDNHTSGDYWLFTADTWGVTISSLTPGSNSYAAGSIVATTLPIRDMPAAVFSTVSVASGASETPASRIYLESTSGLSPGDDIFVQNIGTGNYESATIAGSGVFAAYVDLTTDLINDYAVGDFFTKQDSGEDAYWIRPVATITTVEELKRLRVNARML